MSLNRPSRYPNGYLIALPRMSVLGKVAWSQSKGGLDSACGFTTQALPYSPAGTFLATPHR